MFWPFVQLLLGTNNLTLPFLDWTSSRTQQKKQIKVPINSQVENNLSKCQLDIMVYYSQITYGTHFIVSRDLGPVWH